MKHLILLSIALLIGSSLFAQPETKVQTKPDQITVYTNAAEIHRQARFTTIQGLQYIVFDSLSPNINANTIQVKGKGNFTILDTQFKTRYANPLNTTQSIPPKIQKAINQLEDSIRILNYDLRDYQNQLEVLRMEKNLLMNNQLVKGNGGDTIPELQQTMEFFRAKLIEINSATLKVEKEKYPLDKSLVEMNARLTDLKNYNLRHGGQTQKAVPQILVQISGASKSAGMLEISYLINNAGWYPEYDIRATDEEKTQLIYKAKIYQNTGIDWENTKLILSTSNPLTQHYKPNLSVWWINYYNQQVQQTTRGRYKENRPSSAATLDMEAPVEMDEAGYALQYTQTSASMLNTEFEVNMEYSIPSDGQYHNLPIQSKELKSDYMYYTAPSMSTTAFLVANITDWGDIELLQGQANIYFNGKYNGQTQIYPQTTKDSMEIALGSSKRIIVERKQLSAETEEGLIGNYVTKTFTYEIKLKNNLSKAATIRVEDRIPHSNDKDIEVKLISSDNASFNKDNSYLTWDIDLQANQSKTLKFSFSVKYDSSKGINI